MSFLQDSCAIAETGQKNLSQHLLIRFYKGDALVSGCLEPLNTNWVHILYSCLWLWAWTTYEQLLIKHNKLFIVRNVSFSRQNWFSWHSIGSELSLIRILCSRVHLTGSRCHRLKSLRDITFAVNMRKKCCVQCDECGEKNFWAVNFFLPLKRWKKIFHRYQQDAAKKISALPAECGEKKFSPLKLQSLQIFTALISTFMLYSQEISLKQATDGAVE